MSSRPIRFLHSGDWQLETPLGRVPEIPNDLREPFVEAPYLAAERVVQAAVDQRVDFLLLTGNLLPIERACPYSFEFMLRQFQRLAEHSIHVYWLGGEEDDLDLWPAALALPENVHTFPVGQAKSFNFGRDGDVACRLVGQSLGSQTKWNPSDFAGGGDGVPRIAVASGKANKRSLENKGVDYWALGGDHRHHVLLHGSTTAAYAGSPQGRDPRDTDAHGAVLVELSFGNATLQLVETDVWRWRRERVHVEDVTSTDELQHQLTRRLKEISAESKRFGWLLIWSVVCRGELALRLRHADTRHRLLDELQQLSADDSRWSLDIESEQAELPTEWFDEDSVLGDFLRAVKRYEQDPEAWQTLAAYLPDTDERDALLGELQACTDMQRERIWRCVASWGADLLRGDIELDQVMSAS